MNRQSELVATIAKHFNNPEMSDVTLAVGDQSYHVHRFILAAQSSVFHTMLMNSQWKESNQEVIQLTESPECEAVLGDFLNYFYTGKFTLNCHNVCAIHMLADKYNLPVLKTDAVSVMKDVLEGLQHVLGNAYPNSVLWLPYIEQFIPSLLPLCYDAIRTNFLGFAKNSIDKFLETLESRHLLEILSGNGSEVVVESEHAIFEVVSRWAAVKFKDLSGKKAKAELKPILQSIRFYNIDAEELLKVEESALCKSFGNSFFMDFMFPAYKVHSQMLHLANSNSSFQCLCDRDSDDQEEICPHLNPRLYIKKPYGISHYAIKDSSHTPFNYVLPIDLGDIKRYANLQGVRQGTGVSRCWKVQWKGDYPLECRNDYFIVSPGIDDIGRKFTIAIIVGGLHDGDEKYQYAIKHTGTVMAVNSNVGALAQTVIVYSPYRSEGPLSIDENDDDKNSAFWVGVAIHLHKE